MKDIVSLYLMELPLHLERADGFTENATLSEGSLSELLQKPESDAVRRKA
jgi:hypothetical protein